MQPGLAWVSAFIIGSNPSQIAWRLGAEASTVLVLCERAGAQLVEGDQGLLGDQVCAVYTRNLFQIIQ